MPVQPVNHTYSNTDIKPLYPREELISEEYVQNIITSDMISYRPAAGKIPVGDSEGRIDPAWLVDQVATTTLPIASDTVARDKDNNSAVMTPHSTYVSITNFVHEANTESAGIVKLTAQLDSATLLREDLAVTPKALKDYLRDGFSPATYGSPGVVQFGTDAQISAVLSASKNTTTSSLKTNSQYSSLAVNAYTLYNYISNNHLTLNQDYGIIFRKRSDNSSTVTTEDIAKITVDRSSTVKNMKVIVGSKTATILDSNGDTVLPGTLTVTSRVKQSNGAPPLLGTQNKGSTSQPIYLDGGEVKPIGYTIQANVPANAFNEATTTSKGLMSATDKAKLDGISAGATSYTHPTTAGNKHIPSGGADGQILVYAGSSGTAKWVSQANSGFLPITGGTLTGPITISTGTAYAVGTATPMLSVKYKSTNNKDMAATGVIDVIGTDSSDAYNTPISIGSDDGTTQVGAGESRRGFLGARSLYNNENLYLTADGTINIYPGISNDNSTFGGPLTISSAGSTTLGSKVNITGVNTIDGTAAAASKLTANAGSNTSGSVQPIYFNNGVPAAITQTVGSTSSPVYLNAGKFTAITKIASATKADSLSNTSAIGGTSKPVYFNASGAPVAISDTVGSADIPVYLNKGTITTTGKKFSSYLPLAGGTMTGPIKKSSDVSWVNGVKDEGAIINLTNTGKFGTWVSGYTKSNKVGIGTYPGSNELVYLYSVTKANVTSTTNTTLKALTWNSSTGELSADKFKGALTGNVTGNVSGSSGSCTGNAATATAFSASKAVTLTGAVTGTVSSTAGWTVPTLWRSCMVGQSGKTTTKPWYKVATVAATTASDDIMVDFLVEDTYSSHKYGILKIHIRVGSDKKIDTAHTEVSWLTHTGFTLADFVLVCPTTAGPTCELWTKIATGYMFRRFTVLSEGSRATTGLRVTLLNASSAGQNESLPSDSTQIVSTAKGTVGKLTTARKISIRNWTASWSNGAMVNTSKTAASATFDGSSDVYLDTGCKSSCSGGCISACSVECSSGCSSTCSSNCANSSQGDCCDGN